MEYYQIMKFVHIFGVTMFVGNMLVTALLKGIIAADGTPKLVAFGQRFIKITDIVFYGTSTLLISISGIYMDPHFLNTVYLQYAFVLYIATGVIWVFYFIPVQKKQSELASVFRNGGNIPPLYWKLEKLWTAGGMVSLIIVFFILYLMIFKPV